MFSLHPGVILGICLHKLSYERCFAVCTCPSCCQLAKWRFDPLQITKVWLASMDVNVVKVSVIKKYVCTWRINGCIKHKIPLCVKIVLLFRNIMWFFSLKRSKLHKSFTYLITNVDPVLNFTWTESDLFVRLCYVLMHNSVCSVNWIFYIFQNQ